jgi:hypothetical protein
LERESLPGNCLRNWGRCPAGAEGAQNRQSSIFNRKSSIEPPPSRIRTFVLSYSQSREGASFPRLFYSSLHRHPGDDPPAPPTHLLHYHPSPTGTTAPEAKRSGGAAGGEGAYRLEKLAQHPGRVAQQGIRSSFDPRLFLLKNPPELQETWFLRVRK